MALSSEHNDHRIRRQELALRLVYLTPKKNWHSMCLLGLETDTFIVENSSRNHFVLLKLLLYESLELIGCPKERENFLCAEKIVWE